MRTDEKAATALRTAADTVVARGADYGDARENFERIAALWEVYCRDLGRPFAPADVAAMMALVKLSRLAESPGHADSWVDLAGYAALGSAVCAPPEG